MGIPFWKGVEYAGFRERPDGDWDFFPSRILGRGLQRLSRQQYVALGLGLLTAIFVQVFFPSLLEKIVVFGVAIAVLSPLG